MEKRLLVAVLISIAFLVAWGALVPRFFPELARPDEVPPAPTATATAPPAAAIDTQPYLPPDAPAVVQPEVDAPRPEAIPEAAQEQITVIQHEQYTARLSNRGGQLVSFILKNYDERGGGPVELVKQRPAGQRDYPFALVSSDARWNSVINNRLFRVTDVNRQGARIIEYETSDPAGGIVRKTFTFDPREFTFGFDIEVSTPNLPYRVVVGPGIRNIESVEEDTHFLTTGNLVYQRGGNFQQVDRGRAAPFSVVAQPEFIGLTDNYFLSVLIPRVSAEGTIRAVELVLPEIPQPRRELFAGLNAQAGRVSGQAFFGPKEPDLLDRYGLGETLRFGIFGFISRILLIALVWIHSYVGNWGWAIVLLTVLIKLILYPLQHKSIVSMKKMQAVQPKVAAIKEKFKKAKSDPEQRQKMNMEMMKLYQQEGINPVSGCLPILLQLPILWAFYMLLSNAIQLRGADFALWINDLSMKDPYYITPILMTATMFIQQWLTPSTLDPIQKKIFLAMPIVFGWIFKEFPSGLVLYWLVQNLLTIVQQLIMNHYWKDHPPVAVPAKQAKGRA
jgi:YidC/Oxa1 family membrane protein insertase